MLVLGSVYSKSEGREDMWNISGMTYHSPTLLINSSIFLFFNLVSSSPGRQVQPKLPNFLGSRNQPKKQNDQVFECSEKCSFAVQGGLTYS